MAKEMAIAKSTLIDWNKKADVKEPINEGKAFAINSVVLYGYSFTFPCPTSINFNNVVRYALLHCRFITPTEAFELSASIRQLLDIE